MILSQTRSLLPWDMEIVVPEKQVTLSDRQYGILFQEDVAVLRMREEVLEIQRSIRGVEIPSSVGQQISEDFVKQPQDGKSNKAENLQRQLHLAKCLAASENASQLSFASFQTIQTEDQKSRRQKK